MSLNFHYLDNQKNKKMSEECHDNLINFITKKWDKWNSIRQSSLDAISAIEKMIYPSKKEKKNINIPEVYEIRETYKAHLWKSWFSSVESMFDVQGKCQNDHFMATKQKASLVDIFKEINLTSKFDKGIDNWINKGEFIAFINWSTKYKKFRKKEFVSNAQESVFKYNIENQISYDGPDFTIVNPEAFVFDPEKKENFDSCPKIYRSFSTFDEIQANNLYENFEELNDFAQENDYPVLESENKATKGDQIEILEYWGDIKLSDGTLLKNWVITIAGRKKIIRFEENPFIINPFVFSAFLEDPETKRGISPLYVAIPLNEISTTILNLQIDALRLIINKPYLAPKGSLSGKINVKEGAIIEYDPALMPEPPKALEFKDALVGWDFLKFFEDKIESATGISKYMSGNTQINKQKTATEATNIMFGQNVRLSKEIDILNFKVKIPIIQKIAELAANFSFDIKEIKIAKPNGDIEFVLIDEFVRQGNYDYTIGDGSAIFERKAKLKENLELLYEFAKHPDVSPRLKWIEIVKWSFEQLGSADPNMFIKEEVTQPIPQKGFYV